MKRGRAFNVIVGSVVFLLVGLALPISPAQAQDSIQILQDETSVDYPFSVGFSLSAVSSAAPITSVRLLWQAGPEDVFNVRLLDISPGRTVDAQYGLNTQFLSLPPFAQMTYRWEIRDEAGNALITENRTFEYVDTRSDWQEFDGERVRLLWYGLDDALAGDLYTIADAAYLRLAEAFGVALAQRPLVLIYPDQATFAEFQRFVMNVDYVIGRYFPGHNITANLVMPEMDETVYAATIAHELSHLYSDNFYTGFARIPLWLEEGLATYNEALNRDDDLRLVRWAAARGELIPFLDLPRAIRDVDIDTANLAYAEGATVFLFIEETWGIDSVVSFLTAFQRTTRLEDVTEALFALSAAEFEMAWRAWLGFPVESVPEQAPQPTLAPMIFPTPTFAPPG